MNVFGQLKKARLENIANAVASLKKGFIYFRTDINKPVVDDGVDVSEIAMRKHLGTILEEDQIRKITKWDTKPNLDLLAREIGKFYYATDEEKLYFDDGVELKDASGSGVGGINYIKNFDMQSTNGYASYKDAVQATSEDGLGGTAAAITLATTDSPTYLLRGGKSLLIAKAAGLNGQGEGVSTDIEIDPADKGSMQMIEFDMNTSHLNYESGDIIVEVYDITNGVKLHVSNKVMRAANGKHYATFQAAMDSVSYRIIFHCATDKTDEFLISLDNLLCGPNVIKHATPFGQVGQLIEWPAEQAPDGPLLYCDGSTVSRAVYKDLFEIIGETYGAGDGSTTFEIPDYRDMFLRGDSDTRDVGTYQADDNKSHNHLLVSNVTNFSGTSPWGGGDHILQGGSFGDSTYRLRGTNTNPSVGLSGDSGSEARPKNYAVKIYIVTESLYKSSRYIENINGDVGRIEAFAGSEVPNGTIYADGSWVSKTEYRELWDVIGDKWLNGDSPQTDNFKLPDLQNMFLRGDSSGRDVGVYEADEFKSHTHSETRHDDNPSSGQAVSGGGVLGNNIEYPQTGATGGSETRPKNFSVKYVIRFRSTGASTMFDNGMPIGSKVEYFGASVPRGGYLRCDGSTYLIKDYPKLFEEIGTIYGGDGTTNFAVPDTRGYFMRDLDDGAGVNPDNTVLGGTQSDQFGSHNHVDGTGHWNTWTTPYGSISASTVGPNGSTTLNRRAYTSSSGGNETRPKAMTVSMWIKY